MKKIKRSLLVSSLSAAMIFQNVVVISNGAELKSNTTNYTNSEFLNSQTSATNQPDPETIPHRNMGENPLRSSAQNVLPYATSSKIAVSSNAIGSGVVTAGSLNVRSGPSTSNASIGFLTSGQEVTVLAKTGSWYKISTDNLTGYVSGYYIKLNIVEKGIDVSHHNGTIDWDKVKASGIDYVIIRAGYGTSTVDSKFYNNIKGARDAGLKIGIYWFSYATTAAKAKIEAQKCLDTIAPYKDAISYPVFYDFEYASVDYATKLGVSINKTLASSMASSFLNTVSDAGYITGLYTNQDFGDTYFDSDTLTTNNLWIAQYNSTCSYSRPYIMWQCSESGSVNGISGKVDMNYTYLKPKASNSDNNSNNNNSDSDTDSDNANQKIDLSSASIADIDDQTYTENAIKPDITVKLNNTTLTASKDYTISYSNNTSVGTASITITGTGNYTGSKTINFKILPKKVSNLSLDTKTINSLKFSWAKLDDVTGYKIYKYNSSSDTYELIDTIENNSTTYYTNANLNSASVYKYKVRAYKVVNGNYYYGSYSDIFTDSTKVPKVTNLNLDTRNATSLEISWDKVDNADGYRIYRLNTTTDTYQLVDTIYDNSTTSYKHTGRISATNYYYKVKAFKYLNGSKRYSDYSSVLKATTRPLKPTIHLSSTYTKTINLNWSHISSRTTGYEVYMATYKNGTYSKISTVSNTKFTKSYLTKGKTYYFKVRAYRTVNGENIYSYYSNIGSITCK